MSDDVLDAFKMAECAFGDPRPRDGSVAEQPARRPPDPAGLGFEDDDELAGALARLSQQLKD